MEIRSQITVSIKPELQKSLLKTSAFEPGSTLKLKVIGLRGDRALIDFGSFRSTADIKIPVTLGQELTVKVLASGAQLKLEVIPAAQKNSGTSGSTRQRSDIFSDQNLNKIQQDLTQILNQAANASGGKKIPQSMFNVLANLNAYFEPFELKEIITQLLPRLKSYIENSGLFFEKTLERTIAQAVAETDGGIPKNLADLAEVRAIINRNVKPNLWLLQHFLEDKATLEKIFDPKTLVNIKNAIENLLGDIAQQQGRAFLQMDPADPFQEFTYFLPLKEGAAKAQLKIYYQKKQKSGSRKGFRISLFLSMDRLGDIRTDFLLLEKDLSVTVFVTESATKTTIEENGSQLQELLSNLFDQVRLNVKLSEKKVRDFDHPDVQTKGDRRVDIRI